jgi:hypothetical protein
VLCSFPNTGETHDDAVEHGNMVAADAECRCTRRPSADRGLISHGVEVAARDEPLVGDPPGTRPHSRRREDFIATGSSHMQRSAPHAANEFVQMTQGGTSGVPRSDRLP